MTGPAYIGAIAAAGGTTGGGEPPVGTFYRFDASGAEEEWHVPSGVTSVRAYLIGASGGAGTLSGASVSGAGGYTTGVVAVSPGEVLRVRVGERGRKAIVDPYQGGLGGWPGGGSGAGYPGFGDVIGAGGGGYSGLFRQDGTPILIAGGGGGSVASTFRSAGAGGGESGGDAESFSGSGGTQSAAGPGGGYLQGGAANGGDYSTPTTITGGGGGGGYYGGGAQSSTRYTDHGGGGGSGYVAPAGVSSGATYAGTYKTPPVERPATINGETVAPRGNGVPGVYATRGQDGNDGVIWLETL